MTRASGACHDPAPRPAPEAAPLPAAPEGAVRLDCPMCGLTFTQGGTVCAGCPLHMGCDLVRCPRCSYAFPRGSRVVEWLQRAWRRVAGGARPPGGAAATKADP